MGRFYVVDHVEFDQPATLGDPPPHHGSGLQLIVTAGIFLKYQTDLLDPSKTDTFANLNPGINIYFNVGSHDAEICLSYNTVTSLVDIPKDALAAIDGILQPLNLCTGLDLSALPNVLGDLTVTKAKIATDSEFSILSVRLALGDSPRQRGPVGQFRQLSRGIVSRRPRLGNSPPLGTGGGRVRAVGCRDDAYPQRHFRLLRSRRQVAFGLVRDRSR